MAQLNTSDVIYHNYAVLHPNGKIMFRCDKKKIDWYLRKNLARKVDEKTIQLNFEPNGLGDIGNDYLIQEKENQCVVCGKKEKLTKHHVVPYCYRKHFPQEIKNHNRYDILPLCAQCHSRYEKLFSLPMRRRLEERYDAPLNGRGFNEEVDNRIQASGLARCLVRHGHKIPECRIKEIKAKLESLLGEEILTQELIESLANEVNSKLSYNDDYCTHGEIVMDQVEDIQSFVEEWRQDFINNMNPKYLPEGWKVDESVV